MERIDGVRPRRDPQDLALKGSQLLGRQLGSEIAIRFIGFCSQSIPQIPIEQRLPHRCTYVLVFNSAGDLFIHLRTPTKDVFPSHWDVCIGGVLAAGETFDQGVRREIQEELGVYAVAEPLFPIRYADAATIVHGMVYRLVHNGPFRLQVEEIVRAEFVSVAEVLERIHRDLFCPDGVKVLEQHLRASRTQ
ncbi:MAG TPA: NUDIX domain-containing protein [Gemmataceae bacterium]|nr:NUDIX domain-containing protein [Gemmataceae bacterium]